MSRGFPMLHLTVFHPGLVRAKGESWRNAHRRAHREGAEHSLRYVGVKRQLPRRAS